MQRKIFTIYVVLLVIGVLITGLFAIELLKTSHINNIEDKLKSNSYLIKEFIQSTLGADSSDFDYDEAALKYGGSVGARITIIDKDGHVLGDSSHAPNLMENHRQRPELDIALRGGIGKSIRYSSTADREMFYIAVPLELEDVIIGAVRLALPLDEIKVIYYRFGIYIIISIFIGLIAVTMLGYRYINNVIKPIKEIAIISKSIAHGDLKKRVRVTTSDELGELAESFNYMAERLRLTVDELSDKNTKLEAILTSSINGVIAVDNYQKVIIINPIAEKIFGIDSNYAVGKNIIEVIRNNKLDQSIKSIFNNRISNSTEIEIYHPQYRILNIYTNPITYKMDKGQILGALTLVQDVTEIRKLEKIRSDFVANVTHELRTPLTSIKGFVETLLDGAMDNKEALRRFLGIIHIETERLSRLIQDILTLSEIENRRHEVKIEGINVQEAIQQVLSIMKNISDKKSITIENEIEEQEIIILGNRDRFQQMLINLIDNAIKYGNSNGFVKLLCCSDKGIVKIEVVDNGKGISKEDIPRIFERFYKVDRARTGGHGTGLGLAIVKHIVLSLNGTIKVESELGEGTKFTIVLPKANA